VTRSPHSSTPVDSPAAAPVDQPPVVLASTSAIRRDLLTQLGLTFSMMAPDVDEAPIQQDASLTPRQIAEQLALLKAEAVQQQLQNPEAIIIGCDQVACFQGKVLTKPGTPQANVQQLLHMSGQKHELFTAAVVLQGAQVFPMFVHSELRFRPLTQPELTRYVERDQPWHCAGGYRWEAQGITLFEAIHTTDHTAILGLPLLQLTSILRQLGIPLP